jgi:peroxisomal enoyl-CoA hydratase 2
MIEDIPLPRIDWFPIEAGHIAVFARAIGDPNPIYADPAYARTTAVGGIIAPPTFLEAGIHFDADFPFRPRLNQPWLGSAAEPTGLPADKLDAGTDMHAETHIEYHRLMRPGMVLHGKARRGRAWETEGRRAGRLRFGDSIVEYCDEEERLIVTNRTVIVTTEWKVEQSAPRRQDARSIQVPSLDLPSIYPAFPLRAGDLAVGTMRTCVVASNLTRAQIVQYAGATGDVSPQHVDEVYNTKVAGYPSVFGHGMLTMAMTGRMLTDWVGDGRLTKFGFQFRRQVWPGDSVIATGMINAIGTGVEPLAEVDVQTTNQHGDLLGKGYAVARLAP